MKFFFLILFLPFFVSSEEKPRPIVSVELEWETIDGAKGYEIEIKSNDFNKKFKAKTPLFQIQIPLGQNQARGRAIDFRGVSGEWSDYVSFNAEPQKVDLKSSYESSQPVIKLNGFRGWVQIKWKAIPGAKGYRFYLKDSSGKVIATKDTKEAVATFNTNPGKYSYNVTALYTGGIESDMSEFQPTFEVTGKKLPPPSFVSTESEHKQRSYKLKTADPSLKIIASLEYSPFLADEWDVISEEKIKDSFSLKKLSLPGRYRVLFRTHLPGFADSEPAIQEFIVKPTAEIIGN